MNLSKHFIIRKQITAALALAAAAISLSLLSSCDIGSNQKLMFDNAASRAISFSFTNNADALAAGNPTESAFKTAWATRYVKEIERISITSTAADVYSGKSLKILYPANKITGNSGATWETDIKYSSDEMYMSYWVKFKSDFDFRSGGKLPGLGGSTSFPRGINGFSTRLMWREEGKLEFYLHGYQVNNSFGEEPYRVYWNKDEYLYHTGKSNNSVKVTAGKWHNIIIRQKLNTPGQKNGILQGWLDGVLVCNNTDDANVRAAGQTDTKVNHLFFSTFYGGSSDIELYAPKKNEYAYFDEFKLSTSPISYPGPR